MEGNNYSPTRRAIDLKREGMPNSEIASRLKQERYGRDEISSALDQAAVKNEINPDEVPSPSSMSNEDYTPQPLPTQPRQETMQPQRMPSFAPEPPSRENYDMVEQMAESVVSEKWEDMVKNVGDLRLWKERVETDLAGVKQEILRVQSRFENLQKAVLSKVNEYSQGITDLNAEIKAMEKVFERILGPLTKSVRDLEKVTEKIKK